MTEVIAVDYEDIVCEKCKPGINGAGFSSPEAAVGLSKRLAAAVLEISTIEKRGTNKFFNYDFVTSEDVKRIARIALAHQDIAVIPTIIGRTSEPRITAKGKTQEFYRVQWLYTVACPDGYIQIPWESEALDDQDKGLSKAGTSALKYFLVHLLQIPTGDEPDSDAQGPASTDNPGNGKAKRDAEYWERPMAPERLKEAFTFQLERQGLVNDPSATVKQKGLLVGKLNEMFEQESDPDAFRHTLLKEMWGNVSSKALTQGQFQVLLEWACDDEDDTGDRPINAFATEEAYAVVTEAMREAGQLDLLNLELEEEDFETPLME